MAKKIIIEIDGVRHKRVKTTHVVSCDMCSLSDCVEVLGCSPCTQRTHFILEKK